MYQSLYLSSSPTTASRPSTPLNPSPLAPHIRLWWPLCAFINYIYLLTYILLQMYRGLCVCLSAGHNSEPYKNGWTDRDVIFDLNSSGTKEPFIWCRPGHPEEGTILKCAPCAMRPFVKTLWPLVYRLCCSLWVRGDLPLVSFRLSDQCFIGLLDLVKSIQLPAGPEVGFDEVQQFRVSRILCLSYSLDSLLKTSTFM